MFLLELRYRFSRLSSLSRISLTIIIIILVFGIGIHLIEPKTFASPFEGIWWAIQTIATIGYGDLSPKTIAGKLTAIVLIFTGCALFSAYFYQLVSTTIKSKTDFIAGSAVYKGKNQIILAGWNERTKEMLRLFKQHGETHLVLIDETLQAHPLPNSSLFFIKGDMATDSPWIKANITEAQMIVLTADPSKKERESDIQLIAGLLAAKGINPHINALCEILTPSQITNARNAGATVIIETNTIVGQSFFDKIEQLKET